MKSIPYIVDYAPLIKGLLLAVLMVFALKNDIKNYRIPNKLNLLFLLAGLVLNIVIGSVKSSFGGIVFPLILFPLFALRMMGAGDIKLFCAMGAIVGFPQIINIMAYSIVFNGVIAVFLIFIRKECNGFARLWQYLRYIFITGKLTEYQTLDRDNKNIFRYAYGIALGCAYYIVTSLILGGSYALL